jgi:hypothetical protein
MAARILLGVFCVFALVVSCDDDICPNEYGNAIQCTCSRRCQGVTDTWDFANSCYTDGNAEGAATSACQGSCSPLATCTCTCDIGESCVIDHEGCK